MTGSLLRALPGVGFLVLLGGAGCNSPEWTYNDRVEGTVKMDGVPLVNVLVQFVPDHPKKQGPISSGFTDEKGYFQLTCDNRKPGAVLGKHKVLVFAGRGEAGRAEEDREAPGDQAPAKSRKNPPIPPEYKLAVKTPLRVEVREDQHPYDLTLTRKR
jgi:hypothetical protein